MASKAQPPTHIVDAVRRVSSNLAGAVEHVAWTGVSWRIGAKTFVHVVQIDDERPAAYARVFDTAGPATVITVQADDDERQALAHVGPPFYLPPWRPGIVGVRIDEHTDWTELTELVTDSHGICKRH
jgi:YjbR